MQNTSIIDWAEKRIKRRHKAPGLFCRVSRTGLLSWIRPAQHIHCIDFNRYGMAAVSPVSFKQGEIILVSFKGKYILQSNVKAEVSSCVEREDGVGYRISLVFCYAKDSKHYSRRVDNALSRIEHIYSQR
jgi:hypothetical protein